MSRKVIGPFNRVEGDLKVSLDIHDGVIESAAVTSPLYRGFEQILQGKPVMDALVIAPRVCGICSVSQSVAAAYAIQDATRTPMADNGQLAINLMLASENLADHFTHFYLFFMPDFARDEYQKYSWHPRLAERFKALGGSHARRVLKARSTLLHVMGLLAGKWPHSLAIQPGGSTRPVEKKEKMRLLQTLQAFRRDLEDFTFGDSLETIVGLQSTDQLQNWRGAEQWHESDLRSFLHLAEELHLDQLGVSQAALLSYGAYRQPENGHSFRAGVVTSGRADIDPAQIREDNSHAWLKHDRARHPLEGLTLPEVPDLGRTDTDAPYSWSKAPRYQGWVCETGAFARQVVDGNPLALELAASGHSNVSNRVLMRLWELARVVLLMEDWIRAIQPGQPFCNETQPTKDRALATGAGLVEAARGSLGHWLTLEQDSIRNYQIVAPTTWNFSPRDEQGTPGALEQALAGTLVSESAAAPVQAQHIVRSYDPCMSCTVH